MTELRSAVATRTGRNIRDEIMASLRIGGSGGFEVTKNRD